MQSTCPVHKGDNSSALKVYADSGRWMCFTHGCHGDKSCADLDVLVQKSLGLDEDAALRWLEEALGVADYGGDVGSKVASIEALRGRSRRLVDKIIPADYLDKFVKDSKFEESYYSMRGYTRETLNYFDVRYCFDKRNRYYNRAIVPIHNRDGDLVGVSARWMGDHVADGVDKFLHTTGMPRQRLLYNWHRAFKYFDSGYLLLTESPGAVWGLHQIGRFNAVAALGGALTEDQVKIIQSCPKINTTVLCFDPDEAGRKFTQRAASMLHGKTDVQIIDLTEDFDLDNIQADEFLKFYAARKSYIPVEKE